MLPARRGLEPLRRLFHLPFPGGLQFAPPPREAGHVTILIMTGIDRYIVQEQHHPPHHVYSRGLHGVSNQRPSITKLVPYVCIAASSSVGPADAK